MQRNTAQRQAIEKAIEQAGRPLSVPEIHDAARHALPRLGAATVYRAVNDLLEAGYIKPVDLPGEPARYERADLGHHHHFHCTACDRVFDIEGCALAHKPHVPHGFKVESHEIVLYGRCADCRAD
jgi:Fur family ferric uptake transcriptional regulator